MRIEFIMGIHHGRLIMNHVDASWGFILVVQHGESSLEFMIDGEQDYDSQRSSHEKIDMTSIIMFSLSTMYMNQSSHIDPKP